MAPSEGQSPGEPPEAGQGPRRSVLGRLLRHGRRGPPAPFELLPVGPRAGGAPLRHLWGGRRCAEVAAVADVVSPFPLRSSRFSLRAGLQRSSPCVWLRGGWGWRCPGCWCERCTGRPLPPHLRLQVRGSAGPSPSRFGCLCSRGTDSPQNRLVSQVIFPVLLY